MFEKGANTGRADRGAPGRPAAMEHLHVGNTSLTWSTSRATPFRATFTATFGSAELTHAPCSVANPRVDEVGAQGFTSHAESILVLRNVAPGELPALRIPRVQRLNDNTRTLPTRVLHHAGPIALVVLKPCNACCLSLHRRMVRARKRCSHTVLGRCRGRRTAGCLVRRSPHRKFDEPARTAVQAQPRHRSREGIAAGAVSRSNSAHCRPGGRFPACRLA